MTRTIRDGAFEEDEPSNLGAAHYPPPTPDPILDADKLRLATPLERAAQDWRPPTTTFDDTDLAEPLTTEQAVAMAKNNADERRRQLSAATNLAYANAMKEAYFSLVERVRYESRLRMREEEAFRKWRDLVAAAPADADLGRIAIETLNILATPSDAPMDPATARLEVREHRLAQKCVRYRRAIRQLQRALALQKAVGENHIHRWWQQVEENRRLRAELDRERTRRGQPFMGTTAQPTTAEGSASLPLPARQPEGGGIIQRFITRWLG